MIKPRDDFNSLLEKAGQLDVNSSAGTKYLLQGMQLFTDSINIFNKQSAKLSKLMIGIAGLQVIILLGQIFKLW